MATEARVTAIIEARDRATSILNQFGLSLKSVGAIAAGAFAFNLGVKAVQAAVEFEDAFAGVRKTVDASEAEFERIESRFRELATQIPVSAVEFARIGELAGQLGVQAGEIDRFAEVMAKMAVTTNLSSDQASIAFARIANVMQEPIKNVDRMGSSIVELGNNLATTESEITEFAQRIAGAGNIAGLSTDQILAIGAAMSSVGVQAEAGGTAVQKVLLSINESVFTADKNLSILAETAGISAQEFQESWEEDAGGAFAAFVRGLGEQGDQAMLTLRDMGLEDQRLIRSFLSLANAGETLTNALRLSESAWRENAALNEEAAKRFGTTASQIQLLKQNWDELLRSAGDLFIPIMNTIIPLMVEFIQTIKRLVTEGFEPWVEGFEKIIEFGNRIIEVYERVKSSISGVFSNIGTNIGTGARSLIPGFADGGIVPGPIGAPQLAVVHGGERVIPVGKSGPGGIMVNITGNTISSDLDMRDLADRVGREIMRSLRHAQQL